MDVQGLYNLKKENEWSSLEDFVFLATANTDHPSSTITDRLMVSSIVIQMYVSTQIYAKCICMYIYMLICIYVCMYAYMYICIYLLGLSDSENNTITIVKILVFTIVNAITIVGDQFFNTMIINKKA